MSGFRLLGTPVGSPDFAHNYYNEQIETVNSAMASLTDAIQDIQTRLKLFTQCTIQKLPHLLDSDIMHNYPTSESSTSHHQWTNWYGPLPHGVESMTTKFLSNLLELTPTEQLPQLAILISQLKVNRGGLGFLNASLKAAPNFVLNMMLCHRRSTKGFLINNDINPINLHESIKHLYNPKINTESLCLQRYNSLLPHIAPLCCPLTCPPNECIHLFENNISLHSARGRLKKYLEISLLHKFTMKQQQTTKNTYTYYQVSYFHKCHSL